MPTYFAEVEEYLIEHDIRNCTMGFTILDANNDSLIDVHEFIVVASELSQNFDFDSTKSNQINCSACFT